MGFRWMLPVLLPVMIFYSCNQSKIRAEFTKEELAWLVYQQDDTILFTNESGDVISLWVDFKTDFNQLSNHFPIEAEISLAGPDTSEFARVYLLKDQDSFKRYLKVGDIYRSLDMLQPKPQLELGSNIFKNVYIVQEDTPEDSIKRVFFSKELGIIGFETDDEEIFHLLQ